MRKKIVNNVGWIFLIFLAACGQDRKLPIWGNKEVIEGGSGDTLYHVVAPWEFHNQEGELISSERFKGKICLVDFFFTHCPVMCPKVSSQLRRLQREFQNEDIGILSFTVDPERDSVGRLAWYASKYQLNTDNWSLFTGSKENIYKLGQESFFLHAAEDEQADGGYLHSTSIVLLDKEGRIRGQYDGLENLEVEKLIVDLKLLIDSYEKAG